MEREILRRAISLRKSGSTYPTNWRVLRLFKATVTLGDLAEMFLMDSLIWRVLAETFPS